MSERTAEGLAAARRRGRAGGRKPKLGARQIDAARRMYDEVDHTGKNKFTIEQIAAEFGVTRPTIYRYLDQAERGRGAAVWQPCPLSSTAAVSTGGAIARHGCHPTMALRTAAR